MPSIKTDTDELDLHWNDAEPDLGIASEGLYCKDMDEIVKRIDEVKETVKKINLNNQHTLTEIPSVLKECELLEELNISHTEITVIPGFLFELPNLRSFSCCCRKLSAPPAGIEKAQKLEKLHVRINEGWNFPEKITSLGELKTLSVDIYSAAAFPKDMGALKKLENLTLFIKYETGAIQNLPDSFSKHPALKNINIGDHVFKNHKVFDFEKNAQILSSCPALESLTLSGFTVKKLNDLSHLSGLKELELRHLITEGNIFDSIAALKNLEKLDILGSEFKITELPDIFGNLNQLRSFSFAGNFAPVLPPSLYKLDKLVTLEIGSTGIITLDEKIGDLKNLERIHVYDNLLTKLPESIFTLPSLSVLNIEENFFRQQEITLIKQKLDELANKGQKIEFMYGGQGHRQFVKKLRALRNSDGIDSAVYFRFCMAAINENPASFKYINDDLLTDNEYIQVCLEAALHNAYPDFLGNINASRFSREVYERICWAAVLHLPSAITNMVKPTKELLKLAEDAK
jgi:Leucine-rich repeat (LRR) protein